MAAVSLLWNTNMAAVTSRENALFADLEIFVHFQSLYFFVIRLIVSVEKSDRVLP